MRCTSPRTVGFKDDGKTLCWSPRNFNKEFATFQLPCGKCIECRLDYARQWAVRCVHEAQMHEKNCFITLTYSDDKLVSPKLQYSDFQRFMKRLRKTQNDPIGMFVTGEYGELTKRPHWHAIIFNWLPADAKPLRRTERGDQVYSSDQLTKLWGYGIAEFGSVTFESAGYCARYAAKKLVHGKDDEHDYKPISKKSSKHAIGKKWLEKYYRTDVFTHGKIVLRDGSECSIPRYYEKWLKQNHPGFWESYILGKKAEIIRLAESRAVEEQKEYISELHRRRNLGKSNPLTKNQIKKKIQKQKFEMLQAHLKL